MESSAKPHTSFSPCKVTLQETVDMHLDQLVFYLYKQGGMKLLNQFFEQHRYIVKQIGEHVVGIKYIDGANRLWRTKWAREARGRFYYVDENEVITLKEGLQRGVELLTSAHIEDGVSDTQDVEGRSFELFDDRQRQICNTFLGDNEIRGALTGKVDGSLLDVSIHPIGSKQYDIISSLLNGTVKDPFVSTLVNLCKEKGLPLIVIATSSTLFMALHMHSYFLTSIAPHLRATLDPAKTNLENWQPICLDFINFIMKIYEGIPLQYRENSVHMKFESVCKNRFTYKSEVHPELAVGYNFSGISLLGLVHENNYIPHYKLPETKATVPHPIHLEVTRTTQIFQVMRDLNDVVLSKAEMGPFMEKWFPEQVDYPLHAEGFVYLDETGDGVEIDYCKIKLPIYYKCHKMNHETYTQIPECAEKYFPQLTLFRKSFAPLHSNLVSIVTGTIAAIDATFNKESPMYLCLQDNARKRFDDFFANPFEPKLRETTFRMLLNNRTTKEAMEPLLDEFITPIWGQSNPKKRAVVNAALNEVKIWLPGQNVEQILKDYLDKAGVAGNIFAQIIDQDTAAGSE